MKCAVSTFVSLTWSARPERRRGTGRGTRGGTGPRVRCSPLAVSRPVASAASWRTGCHDSGASQALVLRLVAAVENGRRFVPPAGLPAAERRRSQREPWRERPRVCDRVALPRLRPARGRSRHGCLVTVEVHLQRDSARGHHRGTVAAFCRDSVALSAVEPAGDVFDVSPCRRNHAAHQTAHPWQAVGPSHRRFDRETNETLFAYAHFLGEPTDYVLNEVIDTVLGQGQGVSGLACRAPRVVRAAATGQPAGQKAPLQAPRRLAAVCTGGRSRTVGRARLTGGQER